MKEREKSLKLAKLMGWRVDKDGCAYLFDSGFQPVNPYDTGAFGLSQFAAILLRFPDVMQRFIVEEEFDGLNDVMQWLRVRQDVTCRRGEYIDVKRMLGAPTQADILDEILRMSGEDL